MASPSDRAGLAEGGVVVEVVAVRTADEVDDVSIMSVVLGMIALLVPLRLSAVADALLAVVEVLRAVVVRRLVLVARRDSMHV
jgi:hypothetical protein